MSKIKGSIVENKSRGTWSLLYTDPETGKRTSKKIGLIKDLTRPEALRRAEEIRGSVRLAEERKPLTVKELAAEYKELRQHKLLRENSARVQNAFFENWVIPRWGSNNITELGAKPVEQWLETTALSPGSRGQLRSAVSALWRYAIWANYLPYSEKNPMWDCLVQGVASVRVYRSIKLTVQQFQDWILQLEQPYRAVALVSFACGLRSCECLGLKWEDINWLESTVDLKRSIVKQKEGPCKTKKSKRPMHIPSRVLAVLQQWRQLSEYTEATAWVFASAYHHGKLPLAQFTVRKAYQEAGRKAGIELQEDEILGTHSLRHSFSAWLDAVGTKPRVQKELMRHSKADMTFETYGGVVTDEEREAQDKVIELALKSCDSEDEEKKKV